MIPLVEPAVLYESVAQGLIWLGVAAAAAMAIVVALVAHPVRAGRQSRPAVTPLPRRLRQAA